MSIWRPILKVAIAIVVTLTLFFLAAFFVDPSGVRERLGLVPPLDVPYVATRSAMVEAMLDMAQVGPSDHVIDLGTGDGRILLAAAQDRGAGGLGVDLDPTLIEDASAEAARAGLSDRVTFREQDLFETPLSEASVVTMFLLPSVNLRLRPRLLDELQPGARVVSNRFDMGDWRPDDVRRVGGYEAYLWIVPAQVAGEWRIELEGESIPLRLEQSFQDVRGTAVVDGEMHTLSATLQGDSLRFSLDLEAGERLFEGVVRDDRIEPVGDGEWLAVRAAG